MSFHVVDRGVGSAEKRTARAPLLARPLFGAALTIASLATAALIVSGLQAEANGQTPEPIAAAPLAPEQGGPRRWRATGDDLHLHDAPAEGAEVVGVIADGAVLTNLGCEQSEGRSWCQVRPFRGGARGYLPAERLQPAVGPDGFVPIGVDDSRRRARRGDFDARAQIRCAQEAGEALGVCDAAVARSGGGDATVVVTFPNGFARQLFFTHGAFTRADATMSGVGTDTDWRVEDGLHVIRVDDQRFEAPVVLVIGE